jgi:hypothetical protein
MSKVRRQENYIDDMILDSTVFNYYYQCACCLYSFVCVHLLQGTLKGVGPVNQKIVDP